MLAQLRRGSSPTHAVSARIRRRRPVQMKTTGFVTLSTMILATGLVAASPAHAASDKVVSFGLFGGGLFTDQLEVLGDTPVISPRIGYWINPTLGFEADLA